MPQDAPFRSTVLDPIGRLVSYFPEVKTAIAKREKKLSPSASASIALTAQSTTMRRAARLAS